MQVKHVCMWILPYQWLVLALVLLTWDYIPSTYNGNRLGVASVMQYYYKYSINYRSI